MCFSIIRRCLGLCLSHFCYPLQNEETPKAREEEKADRLIRPLYGPFRGIRGIHCTIISQRLRNFLNFLPHVLVYFFLLSDHWIVAIHFHGNVNPSIIYHFTVIKYGYHIPVFVDISTARRKVLFLFLWLFVHKWNENRQKRKKFPQKVKYVCHFCTPCVKWIAPRQSERTPSVCFAGGFFVIARYRVKLLSFYPLGP